MPQQCLAVSPVRASRLHFERVDGPFGVIVHGIDWDNVQEEEVMLLKQAMRRHLLLVLRGQVSPTREQQDTFFGRFGTVMTETFDGTFHYNLFSKDNSKAIHKAQHGFVLNADPGLPELDWHTDHFHKPQLKIMSVLEAMEFERGAAPTQFRDTYTAYELLPASLRTRLEHKQGIYFDPRLPSPDRQPRLCDAMHPIFTAHPESGRRSLYVMDFTSRIAGVSREESDALLAELHDWQASYAPFYSHAWQVGDIAVVDNVGLQHKRPPATGDFRRVIRGYEGVAEA